LGDLRLDLVLGDLRLGDFAFGDLDLVLVLGDLRLDLVLGDLRLGDFAFGNALLVRRLFEPALTLNQRFTPLELDLTSYSLPSLPVIFVFIGSSAALAEGDGSNRGYWVDIFESVQKCPNKFAKYSFHVKMEDFNR
jgi:hypothetical protein